MTRARFAASGALLLITACADPAPGPTPAPRPLAAVARAQVSPAAESITATDMYNRVAILAADSMRGRDTPSPGLESTAAYLVREYQRLGLEPGGENGTFYQRYPLRVGALDTASVHFGTVLADGTGNEMLAYGTDFYVAPGSGIVGTDMNHSGLVFVGRMTEAGLPTADYKGTVPIVTVPGGYSSGWRSEVARAREVARAAGATGVGVVVDSTFPEQTFRQLAVNARNARITSLGEGHIPVFYLSHRAFRAISARAGGLLRRVTPGTVVPLAPVSAHFAATQRVLQEDRPPNVVAVLRGSDPTLRDEYVVLSAHMDHVGVGTPMGGDSIYNGADDNGSGTATLLEIAEAMASLPTRPRRSIIFLHVSGEEKGLLGSQWFVEHPTVPLNRMVANINVDMIGRNSPETVVLVGKNYSSLGRTVEDLQARHPELGLRVIDDPWPELRFFFRSDHYNFAQKEIPAVFFFAGEHEDYHRPSDHVEKLNVDKAARVARLIYYTAESVANAADRPRWDPRGLAEVRALTR